MYRPRRIVTDSDWCDGDGVKIYTISVDESEVDQTEFLSRLAEVKTERDVDWPNTPTFCIFHVGQTALYMVLAWWGNDNELFTSVSVRIESQWVEDPSRFSFCLFDLEVFWAERNAFVETMYTRSPDLAEYRRRRATVALRASRNGGVQDMEADELADALTWFASEANAFYSEVSELDVAPVVAQSDIREHLQSRYDFAAPQPLISVLDDVRNVLRQWTVHVTHPRCFGYFNPSVTPASIIGDSLAALYNPQLAVWSHAPAAIEIEQHVLRLFLDHFGFDPSSSVANFATGGAEANLSALIAALTHRFPGYADEGLASAPAQPTVYLSAEGHESFVKAAHATGIGRNAIRLVPTDDKLRLDVERLKAMIRDDRERGRCPLMVVGTAGTTAAGIIDPLTQLGDLARRESLWLHVDAAWGGAAVLSRRLSGALAGIDLADSITCDAHKWLSVPMGAGMFFCRHGGAVRNSFRISTEYMPNSPEDVVDPYVSSLQWSRRFIGLKVFLPLASLGVGGVEEMINRQVEVGDQLRNVLRQDGWEILNETPLPVVCFTRPELLDRPDLTRDVAARVVESGTAWISSVTLSNRRPALRACITSFRTDVPDLERLVTALRSAL